MIKKKTAFIVRYIEKHFSSIESTYRIIWATICAKTRTILRWSFLYVTLSSHAHALAFFLSTFIKSQNKFCLMTCSWRFTCFFSCSSGADTKSHHIALLYKIKDLSLRNNIILESSFSIHYLLMNDKDWYNFKMMIFYKYFYEAPTF